MAVSTRSQFTPSLVEMWKPLLRAQEKDTSIMTDDEIFGPLYLLCSDLCPALDSLPVDDVQILVRRIGARLRLEGSPVFVETSGHHFAERIVKVLDEEELVAETKEELKKLIHEELSMWLSRSQTDRENEDAETLEIQDAPRISSRQKGSRKVLGELKVVQVGGKKNGKGEGKITGQECWI